MVVGLLISVTSRTTISLLPRSVIKAKQRFAAPHSEGGIGADETVGTEELLGLDMEAPVAEPQPAASSAVKATRRIHRPVLQFIQRKRLALRLVISGRRRSGRNSAPPTISFEVAEF